jgi:hypothetical protein
MSGRLTLTVLMPLAVEHSGLRGLCAHCQLRDLQSGHCCGAAGDIA